MFWGLIMEPRRRYSQEVIRPFHVSMASLDISSCTEDAVQLMVQFQKRNYLLCTLQKGVALQVPLDLNFESGDKVSFTINGSSHIHLTGYHMEDEFENTNEEDSDGEEVDEQQMVNEEAEDDEDEADLSQSNIVYGKRKSLNAATNLTPAAKRSKTLELLANSAGSDDEDDSDDEDVVFSDLGSDEDNDEYTTLDTVDDDDLEEDSSEEEQQDETSDDEEEEEQEDEEEDQSFEEIEKQLVEAKPSKSQKRKEKQREKQQANQKQQQSPEKPQKKQQNKKGEAKQQQQQKQQQQPQVNGTPTSEKKKKKKNKQKQEQTESPAREQLNVSTKDKKQDQPKTPKNDKKQQNQQNSPQKKVVDRGVVIEDILAGHGNPAKHGKVAHMYYEGRLKQNNKMFDSSVKGPPFKFRLGAAEVIKGWDVGIMGMKVGGKRRITVPPQMAYGSKGIPPEIPPNSTLIFELELKNVT